MKLLFFMDVLIFGGCEKMIVEITNELLKKNYKIELLLIYKSKNNTYLEMLDKRINVHYLWNEETNSNSRSRIRYWANVLIPKYVLNKFDFSKYDLVINFKDDYQTNILSSNISCNKISWVHNINQSYKNIEKKGIKFRLANIMYKFIDKKYYKSFTFFDEVICVSKHAEISLLENVKQKIRTHIIYNYIDYEKIVNLSRKPISDFSFEEFTFCYLGRLSAEKGVLELMDIFSKIPSDLNYKLVIIGEGYLKEKMQKMITIENKKKIIFLSPKSNPYPYILNSDVLICPSHRESFGLTVLESILLKTLVVSTKCGGPEEIIQNGYNGFLVDNYNELKNLLISLLKNGKSEYNFEIDKYIQLEKIFYKELNNILKIYHRKEL